MTSSTLPFTAALNEKLVFVKIEIVPLKRRSLAHAKTETLGYLYHRAPRLLQCRDDEFELLHSERGRALPALADAFHANRRNRVSALVEEFPPRGALDIKCITLRMWAFDFGAMERFFNQSSTAIGGIFRAENRPI